MRDGIKQEARFKVHEADWKAPPSGLREVEKCARLTTKRRTHDRSPPASRSLENERPHAQWRVRLTRGGPASNDDTRVPSRSTHGAGKVKIPPNQKYPTNFYCDERRIAQSQTDWQGFFYVFSAWSTASGRANGTLVTTCVTRVEVGSVLNPCHANDGAGSFLLLPAYAASTRVIRIRRDFGRSRRDDKRSGQKVAQPLAMFRYQQIENNKAQRGLRHPNDVSENDGDERG